MNIQESIRKILKEETSLQLRLRDVIRTHGLKKAIKSVGGVNNFKKIFNNDLTIIYEELDPPYNHKLWEMGFSTEDRIEIFKLIFGDDIEIEGIDNGGDIYVYQEVGGNVGINKPYYEYFDGTHWEYKEFDENGYTNYMADSEGREVKLKHDDEGRQTYLEIPSTGDWEKWEYDDQGNTTRYETSWGTYKDFTKEENLNESYRFKMRRVIHVIEDYIDNLNPNDICNYWTLEEEDDYVRQTMLEVVRFVIDELNVESEYYTDVYDEIYGHVIDFGYQDKIRDFFIETKDKLCGGYNINESTNRSLQDKLLQMYNSKGIEFVIKAVNGVDNLRNIMGDKIEKFITEPYFENLQYFDINPDEWNRILSNIFNKPVRYVKKKESSAFDSTYEVFDKETKNELYSEAFTSGYWVKYGYDVDNNRTYEESQSGYIQKRKYNQNKQLLRWEDNNGEWREWDYDENGNKTYEGSSKGIWSKYKYNEDGNIIWRESSDGSWCKWGYDENGDLDYYITDEGVKHNVK